MACRHLDGVLCATDPVNIYGTLSKEGQSAWAEMFMMKYGQGAK